ncbi:chaperone protein HSP26, partial [Ascoidea rubescens DSM 1968]
PPIDILEFETNYMIYISVPGASTKDIRLSFDYDRNALIVSGQISKYDRTLRSSIRVIERATGKFERYIPLPYSPRIDDTRIITNYTDGILAISIPKL